MERKLTREMLEALVETQERIDKLELKEMLRFIISQMVEILKIERCSIFKVCHELEEFQLMAGLPQDGHGMGQKFPFHELIALEEVLEKKTWLTIIEPGNDARTQASKELIYFKGIVAILIIPLMVEDEVGWLLVADATKGRRGFSEEEIDFCLTLSKLAGLLLERDMMQKERSEKETLLISARVAAEAVDRLKNPVDAIVGFAKRLTKVMIDANCKTRYRRFSYVREILTESAKLEKTVDALVRFSRPKRSNVGEVDINKIIIKEAGQSINGLKEGKDIKLVFKLDPELPLIVADPLDLKEIISPIIRNAIEAIQTAGEIRIKTREDSGFVKVFISNNGGCIDDEVLREIFNPFFTTKLGGTGLGLATAMMAVEAYDGSIRVENDKEMKVTTFIVNLPLTGVAHKGGQHVFGEL